jgi:riboflavin kinase / FMN adenylyltransferase
MRVVSWDEEPPLAEVDVAATIGAFDGMHLGHQNLLNAIKAQGKLGYRSMVISFAENPKKALAPRAFPGEISTLRQKTEYLAGLGVDTLLLVEFTPAFQRMDGGLFLERLRRDYRLRKLVIGENARIGRSAKMDSGEIVKAALALGIEADILPTLSLDGVRVSSSAIRALIGQGKLDQASRYLGHLFELDISAWKAEPLPGGELRLTSPRLGQVLPPEGLYPVELVSSGASGAGETRLRIAFRGECCQLYVERADGLPTGLRFV